MPENDDLPFPGAAGGTGKEEVAEAPSTSADLFESTEAPSTAADLFESTEAPSTAAESPEPIVDEVSRASHRYAPPESEQHDVPWRDFQPVTRLAVMLGIGAGFLYLKFLWDRDHENVPILWIITVIAESFVVLHSLGIWFTLVSFRNDIPESAGIGVVRQELLAGIRQPSVDVFITHATEPLDMLLPTMIAAKNMTVPHRTWVLDDGRNHLVRDACGRLGIGYLCRDDRRHAKAGNVNAAVGKTDGEFFVVIDADHIPRPDFLVQLLPHLLGNPSVAMVQSPQTYDIKGRGKVAEGAAVSQELFYEAILPAKNLSNASICVGTNVVFRRAALKSLRHRPETWREKRAAEKAGAPADREMPLTKLGEEYPEGGIWVGSNSEDVWTSMELQRRGWRTIFVPKTLSRGLTPDTMASFLKQQFRWACGGWEVVLQGKILNDHRLTISQKLQYLLIATHYLQAFAVTAVATLAPYYLFTDRSPIKSPFLNWAIHFLPFVILTLLITMVQAGQLNISATCVSLAAAPAHIRAFFVTLTGRKTGWSVTNSRQGVAILRPLKPHIILAVIDLAAIPAVFMVDQRDFSSAMIAVSFCVMQCLIVGWQIHASVVGKRLAEEAEANEPSDEQALHLLDEYLATLAPHEQRELAGVAS